jgi:hypothetical protein
MGSGQEINFCRLGQISTCTAANQKQQAGCIFYEKSRNAERCMYFCFDEFCDCLKAQLSAKVHD